MWEKRIWDEMRRMREEIDSLFGRWEPFGRKERQLLFGPPEGALANFRQPLADFVEKDNLMVAKVEIPGVEKGDIKISSTKEGIEIKAEKKDEFKEEDKKQGRYQFERSYTGFYRYISLPKDADIENIDASYKNGMLELRIPKTSKGEKSSKKIQVK